jgi:protein involved in polysaccharide export with SLBB domain
MAEEDVPAEVALAKERLRDRILAANPYKLDADGQLRIPGLPEPIQLAGLTEEQASERLAREPGLRDFDIALTLLELRPIGIDALKPFGYDLFSNVPTTFAPATDIPVPPEYAVGPGDTVKVQLIGNVKANYTFVVGRDGEIRFPEIGPVTVAGMPFDELRKLIETTVAEQMIGTRAVVGMGNLRSLRVLVAGDAERPGSYTVSGLSTMTNALLVSGGVKPIGSLRNIQLKRGSRVIATLDLYDLLLRGDSKSDARILSGDVLFIPPVGKTAGVAGAIRRPAIYEFKGEATAGDLVALGGGLTADAAPRLARIERIDPGQGRLLLDVDLSTEAGRATRLNSGDILRIEAARPTLADSVTVTGHVYRPGTSQFRAGLRLTDLLPSVDDLKPNADLHYVLIRRELPPDRRVVVVSADIAQAWQRPQSAANVVLYPRDQIFVFDLESARNDALDPLLADLQRQSNREQPTQIVEIDGSVRKPGSYPLEAGMTVSDLVRAGGGLDEAAFASGAELTRYEVVNGDSRRTALVEIDLAGALTGDPVADVALQPYDLLTIRQVPQWSQQETMLIEGEVRFPGRYAILRGDTLGAVIQRAGGLTDLAFEEGVVFTRKSLQEREAKQIEALTDRLERDLAALAVQTSQTPGQTGAASLSVGQSLLSELRNTKPVGRLAINLPQVLQAQPGSPADILLKNGDRLVVPRRSQEVTVLGEVQTVTSLLYQPGLTRSDYLGLSGGLTQKADKGRIYVVRANGEVVASSGKWWSRSDANQMRPGDTIVVPVDTERLPPLPLWTSVTSIIYNLAVAVAAVNSF